MTANEIIIEAKQEIIKAIQKENQLNKIELKIRIGKDGGIIREVDAYEVCTEAEINQMKELMKELIIAGVQREIDNLKANPE